MSTEKNTVPVITSLKDSKGAEIPNGGTTSATAVELSGLAPAADTVEIFDNAAVKGRVTANAAGDWLFHLTGLSVGVHSITAKGEAGTSAAHRFTVVAAK
ncbi:hypothetical protein ACU680_09025 [Pseudomonas koreensis]